MNRFVKLASVTLLGVAVTGSLALAEEGGRQRERGGKGGGERHQRMKEADTNEDGKVSFEEFKAARVKHMEEMFKRLDRNKDGFLSREDHPKGGEHGKRGEGEGGKRREKPEAGDND